MSDLNYSQFTSLFTAMLQSCNISNNKKYTFVNFLFQMSLSYFLSAANNPSKNKSFEQRTQP